MKTQVAWSFSRSRTELQVTPQRGEALDIRRAEWLQSLNSELLLPLYYDPEKAHTNKLVLYYDITGHTALKRRLPRVWSLESYYAVLEGIERVCEECSSGTHLIERIIFDVDHVYLNEAGEPRFVYVPMNGVAYDATQNSPLLVIAALAGRRVRFDSAAATGIAADLRQWVLTKSVFSPNDFRSLLDREFADLRKADRGDQVAWNAVPKPSEEQIAFMDSLFASFGSSDETGAGE